MTFCCCLFFYGRVVVSLTHSPFPFSILSCLAFSLMCFVCMPLMFLWYIWRGSVLIHPVIVLLFYGKFLYTCNCLLIFLMCLVYSFLCFSVIYLLSFIVIKILTKCWLLYPFWTFLPSIISFCSVHTSLSI